MALKRTLNLVVIEGCKGFGFIVTTEGKGSVMKEFRLYRDALSFAKQESVRTGYGIYRYLGTVYGKECAGALEECEVKAGKRSA